MKKILCLIAVGTLFSCGEPLAPGLSRWQIVVRLPEDISCRSIAISKDAVFGVGYRNYGWPSSPVVIEFGHGGYVINELNDGLELLTISRPDSPFAGELWIGGSEKTNQTRIPMLMRRNERGTWEKLPTAGIPGREIKAVYPYSDTGAWLIAATGDGGGCEGILVRYELSDVKIYSSFGPVVAYCVTDEFGSTTVMAVSNNNNTTPPSFTLYASTDNGDTWINEEIPQTYGSYKLTAINGIRLIYRPLLDETVCVAICEFGDSGPGAMGLVSRFGPLGRGDYELTFLSYPGPYFAGITAVAGRAGYNPVSRDVFSDIVAVGNNTTVVERNSTINLEEVPWLVSFYDVQYNQYGSEGFYAIGRNNTFREYELLYHP